MIKSLMERVQFPIAEEWYDAKQLKELKSKENYVPIKPEWVKVEFNEGRPRLFAHYQHIWQIRPIARKVYDVWLIQALGEYETSTAREATGQSAPSIGEIRKRI